MTTLLSPPTPDNVTIFQLESSDVRGRFVRLQHSTRDILGYRDYPQPVEKLLGRTLALTTGLAAFLKYDGVFTLQMQAVDQNKAAVPFVVCDITGDGDLRGYAHLAEGATFADTDDLHDLLGDGRLAFTVHKGSTQTPYQGIVPLLDSLTASIENYFELSEQIRAGVKLAYHDDIAAALILQRMPRVAPRSEIKSPDDDGEDWRRIAMLLGTAKDEELLDPALAPADLLYRLFHEEGVRVHPPKQVQAQCQCSDEQMQQVFQMIPEVERPDLAVDGQMTITCEFCQQVYGFPIKNQD